MPNFFTQQPKRHEVLQQRIDDAQRVMNREYDIIWQFQSRLNELDRLARQRPLTNPELAAKNALQQGIKDINQHLTDLQPQVLLERKRAELLELESPQSAFSA